MILVYADEGVGPRSLKETCHLFPSVKRVKHKTLIETDWEKETKLLIFPGGRDIPYDRALKGKGTAKIRRFVEEGGAYLGICAGAYFGAGEVIFEKGTALEVHEERDLAFFPGSAVGTIYPDRSFSYDSEAGARTAKVSFEGEIFDVYYNGGCTFHHTEQYPNTTVLARYANADDQPAVIHCKVGKGNILLSGVHIETEKVLAEKLLKELF
ncbi:BPL-N domain-containing protein [Candidatus Neptunochlamydia vexilliferae]|uniref:Biotin-protein ligase N-terminal domain-containing protein n=1 Tax=Candidatus Neptunichlamydia vexilliferae TaxID=1651774 RepID=A0ABS0AZJ3_9BACT|nr:BPL-N domain-containing protein [Candidatus Neptunochlamydia vexilliferae]MBF5059561.1 hypothetical protein [Candidatus Neptunochlamydia vexilliferae]